MVNKHPSISKKYTYTYINLTCYFVGSLIKCKPRHVITDSLAGSKLKQNSFLISSTEV